MLRPTVAILSVVLALPGTAFAQAEEPAGPAINLSSKSQQAQCGTATGDELIVCGNRERSPYRIDETSLDVDRAKEAASNPSRVQDRSGSANLCGTVRNECGGGVIPFLEPALRVVTAVVDAVRGDNWRQAFRNGPSDYDRYEAAKAKRGGISIGVSAGNGGLR